METNAINAEQGLLALAQAAIETTGIYTDTEFVNEPIELHRGWWSSFSDQLNPYKHPERPEITLALRKAFPEERGAVLTDHFIAGEKLWKIFFPNGLDKNGKHVLTFTVDDQVYDFKLYIYEKTIWGRKNIWKNI